MDWVPFEYKVVELLGAIRAASREQVLILEEIRDNQYDLKDTLVTVAEQNQASVDAFADRVVQEANEIAAAVAVVASEIGKLQAAAEVELDTSKVDDAVSRLDAASSALQGLEPPAPVDTPPADAPPAETPVPDGTPVVDGAPVVDAPPADEAPADAPVFEPADGVGPPENPPVDGEAVDPDADNFRLQ